MKKETLEKLEAFISAVERMAFAASSFIGEDATKQVVKTGFDLRHALQKEPVTD